MTARSTASIFPAASSAATRQTPCCRRGRTSAVWRYLAAFSQDGTLCEELGCLSRKISRCAKLPLSAGKTRICLDVLAEQGLVQLEQRPKTLLIRLCADGRKVDLEKSPILIHLKKQKAGT